MSQSPVEVVTFVGMGANCVGHKYNLNISQTCRNAPHYSVAAGIGGLGDQMTLGVTRVDRTAPRHSRN